MNMDRSHGGSVAASDRTRLRVIVGASGIFGLFPLSLSPLVVAAAQQHLALSAVDAGLLATAMLAGVSAAALSLGAIANRLSLRVTYVSGLLLVLTVQTLMLVSPTESFLSLCLLWLISGLGSGCGIVVGDVLLARTRNPMMMAGLGMAITSALMLCVFPLGTHLISALGFPATSLLSLGSVLAAFALLYRADLQGLVGRDPSFARPRFGALNSSALALAVAIGFFWIRDGMIWSFSATSAQRLGIDLADVGLLLGLAGVCGVLGCCASAWVSRSGSVKRSTMFYAVVSSAVVASAWAFSVTPIEFTALQLTYNAAQLFAYPLLLGFAAQLDRTGRLAAFSGGMTLFGAATGPVASGMAVQQWGNSGLVAGVGLISLISVFAFLIAIQDSRQELEESRA